MTPAVWPRDEPLEERLLWIDPLAGGWEERRVGDLPRLLRAGDLLVVNDAATLPASLSGTTSRGERVEIRLAGAGRDETRWTAVAFGEGDWRLPTENRPPPPPLEAGERLRFGESLVAYVEHVSSVSHRLIDLRFVPGGAAFWEGLYRLGRPVQYSYLRAPLRLEQVQTRYGARPWAVEPPSAGRPLQLTMLRELAREDVALASVTHAAGLSATGEPGLDAALPLPERFDIPRETVESIARARARGGRVVAVGTTVVRALEGSAALHAGRLAEGEGVTDLRLGPGFRPKVVHGLLTGIHEPGTSHYALLEAFVAPATLAAATRHAEQAGYLTHEFGDGMLVLERS